VFDVVEPTPGLILGMSFYALDGNVVLQCLTTSSYKPLDALSPGRYSIEGVLDNNVLIPGRYLIELGAHDGREQQDLIPRALSIEVVDSESVDTERWLGHAAGYVRIPMSWTPPAPVKDGARAG
jgi:hypothetical protein